jgi:aminotransferase
MFNLASTMTNVINFGIGEPDFATPAHIAAAGANAAQSGFTHYTANAGDIRLRRAITTTFERRMGTAVDPETEVIVTVGAMEALFLAQQVVLSPGDELLMASPAWPSYIAHAQMAGVTPVLVPTTEAEGFRLNADRLRAAITPKSRALLLNSPSNPTGAVLTRADLEAIAAVCKEHNLIVFADEVYERIVYDGIVPVSMAAIPGMQDRTVTINSMSKTYAMCGWRLGWAHGPRELIAQMVKFQEHIVACASSVAQAAAIAALEGPQDDLADMVARYGQRRRLLVDGLNRIPGITCRLPDGTFYAFANVKGLGKPSQELALNLLKSAGVVTVPGVGFGPEGEGYLRLSFAVPEAIITQGLERLDRAVRAGI